MSDREELIKLVFNTPDLLVSPDAALMVAEHLIANGVTVQKHGRWILHKHGKATCDQCRFTQLNVRDYDRWQRFCGVCGALMDLPPLLKGE